MTEDGHANDYAQHDGQWNQISGWPRRTGEINGQVAAGDHAEVHANRGALRKSVPRLVLGAQVLQPQFEGAQEPLILVPGVGPKLRV